MATMVSSLQQLTITSPESSDARTLAVAIKNPSVLVALARQSGRCPASSHRRWVAHARLSNDPDTWILAGAAAWAGNNLYATVVALVHATATSGIPLKGTIKKWWVLARVADHPQG